jgi:hypothetical protein
VGLRAGLNIDDTGKKSLASAGDRTPVVQCGVRNLLIELPQNIVKIVKSRRPRCARVRQIRHTDFWWGNLLENG